MEDKVQIKLNILMQYLYEKIPDDADYVMYLVGAYVGEIVKKIKTGV